MKPRAIRLGLAAALLGLYYACQAPLPQAPGTRQQSLRTTGATAYNAPTCGALGSWLQAHGQTSEAAAQLAQALQLDVDPQGRVAVFVTRRVGTPWPVIPGLVWFTRRGTIATARLTQQALLELRQLPGIARIEASRRQHPARDLAETSALAHSSSFDPKKPTEHSQTYVLDPTAPVAHVNGAITIRAYAAYDSKQKTPELLPQLQLCQDAACKVVFDRDIGAYDTKLPSGVVDPKKTPVSHARVAYTFSAGTAHKLYIKLTGLAVTGSGRFTLVLSSRELLLKPSDLTGGDITATKRAIHLGNESAQIQRQHNVSGAGALVGIIDTGIDWCHPDFVDASGRSRILALWDQTIKPVQGERSPDVGNDGDATNDYGVLYTQQQLTAALGSCDAKAVRSNDTNGHGTHVAGIAAGGGAQPGVAPKAGLVIVKYTFYSSQQADAISFLLNEAARRKQGIAINMSLGTSAGPKDGTTAQERFITSVVGPGKNIIVAAGNGGSSAIHAQGIVKPQDSAEIKFAYSKSSRYQGTTIGLYTDPNDTYELLLTAPDGKTYNVGWGQRKSWNETGYRVYLGAGAGSLPRVYESYFGVIYDKPTAQTEEWSLTLKRSRSNGTGQFDAYIPTTRSNARFRSQTPRHSDGSYQGTVASPASSPGSLSVASYSMRYVFDALKSPLTYYSSYKTFGLLATSSSRGPLGDGRPGIDIGAPGQYVSSTQSRHRSQDRTTLVDPLYRAVSGTSMAAPMVTGAAALALQREPSLFVRPLLRHHARTPGCCPTPDERLWGAGMLSLQGVIDAVANGSPPTVALATKAGPTQQAPPFAMVLVATSPDKIAEYHWDTDGDGSTDAITQAPEIPATLTQPGAYLLRVTAYNDAGYGASATLAVTVLGASQEPGSEGTESGADAGATLDAKEAATGDSDPTGSDATPSEGTEPQATEPKAEPSADATLAEPPTSQEPGQEPPVEPEPREPPPEPTADDSPDGRSDGTRADTAGQEQPVDAANSDTPAPGADRRQEPLPPKPPGGCGCTASPTGVPQGLLWWLGLLLWLGVATRSRHQRATSGQR